MFRVALKNLIAHKIRSLGLIVTVVLGVSFVVGTYVLTDTVSNVFNGIFTDVYAGVDVNVRHSSELGLDAARPPVPASLLEQIEGVDGVGHAEGNVFGPGVEIIDANGDRVGNPRAPAFGTVWAHDAHLTPFILRRGTMPVAADDVAIDARSFDSGHFALGERIMLVTPHGPQQFTLVGVAGFGRASNLAGATISIFTLHTAQTLLDRVGQFDSINIAAADGVDPAVLQEDVAARISPDYEAVSSADLTNENSKAVSSVMQYFQTFMLVFAFVALLVGAFIVYNTYSIVIAERTRELALVRALGASGAAVFASVIAEAVVTGLLASGLGIAAGVGIAIALQRLLSAVGFTMPSGDLVLAGRTIWVALVGGPLVTVMASVMPAVKASRVAPLAAMRDSTNGGNSGVIRNVLGGVIGTSGVAAVLVGLDRGALSFVGAGAIAVFVGLAMIAPMLSRPVVSALGAPVEAACGVTGMVARDNARRSPRRTATTASALMIGTALMAASFILSQSITKSVERSVSGTVAADLVVTADSQAGFSDTLAGEIEAVPGVHSIARFRTAQFKIGNATKSIAGVPAAALDFASPDLAIDIAVTAGDIRGLAHGGIAVHDDVAHDQGWKIGDTINATFPLGDRPLTLVATYAHDTLVGDYLVDLPTFAGTYVDTADLVGIISVEQNADVKTVQAAIQHIVDVRYPSTKVQDRKQYVADMKAQVAQFTSLITALLLLAVLIALLGVLITMLLAVSERTREIGLLRAVGMSRRQVRSMVRWEAAMVSLFGALMGLAVGAFFGIALVRALAGQGITVTVVPVITLVILAMAIALLGVIASMYPARRAARLNVMAAMANG